MTRARRVTEAKTNENGRERQNRQWIRNRKNEGRDEIAPLILSLELPFRFRRSREIDLPADDEQDKTSANSHPLLFGQERVRDSRQTQPRDQSVKAIGDSDSEPCHESGTPTGSQRSADTEHADGSHGRRHGKANYQTFEKQEHRLSHKPGIVAGSGSRGNSRFKGLVAKLLSRGLALSS